MVNYFLGCDVSKGYCDFVILDEKFDIKQKNFQLDDTRKGHKTLFDTLSSNIDSENYMIYAGLESTGGYEDHWYDAIKIFYPDINIKVARVKGINTLLSDKISSNQARTDATSALTIAKYLIRFHDQINYELFDYWSDLRKQWAFIKLITKQKTQLKNHLHSLMYKYNPGFISFMKGSLSNWFLSLLIKYPTPLKIKNAKISGLTKIPHITKTKAQKLKDLVKVSSFETPEEIGEIIKTICLQINLNNEIIGKQLEYLKKQISEEELELLLSFNGIDVLSAIGLLVEIGCVNRFVSKGHLVAYFGLNVVFRKSGDGQYGMHMRKGGRTEAKRLLYMIALSSISHNTDIRRFYLKKRIEGKHSMVAIGACMRKILITIYSMLKNKEKFQNRIDKKDLIELEIKYEEIQDLKREQRAKEKFKKNRKIDSFDSNAPISNRETQIRNAYMRLIEEDKSRNINHDTNFQ